MVLAPVLRQRYLDANGDPLSGGKLYSYIAGTTTPLATYSDQAGSTPNTNPVILDADGYADVWISPTSDYKFVLTDSADVQLWSRDNISADGDASDDAGETASAWSEHAITDGQAAADLADQTVDFSLYSSAKYDVEIIRGTTINVGGTLEVQSDNGTASVVLGPFIGRGPHGVTFSVSQASTVATLRAATSTGPGAGTIKLTRRLVPA
jgi:hypothetical protein